MVVMVIGIVAHGVQLELDPSTELELELDPATDELELDSENELELELKHSIGQESSQGVSSTCLFSL